MFLLIVPFLVTLVLVPLNILKSTTHVDEVSLKNSRIIKIVIIVRYKVNKFSLYSYTNKWFYKWDQLNIFIRSSILNHFEYEGSQLIDFIPPGKLDDLSNIICHTNVKFFTWFLKAFTYKFEKLLLDMNEKFSSNTSIVHSPPKNNQIIFLVWHVCYMKGIYVS